MKKIILSLIALTVSAFSFAEKISIAVNPGEVYKKRAPQMALWVEDADGTFVETLYVTKKAAANKWIGKPKEGRPESLPDWYKAKGQNPAEKIAKEDLDATTSATPKKGIVIEKELELEKNRTYVFKCQVNQSFDYNDFYTKENSGVDGQPAVLYSGELIPDGTEKEIKLELKDAAANITTADKILGNIFVAIKQSLK